MHAGGVDRGDLGLEAGGDLTAVDAVAEIRADPVLERAAGLRAPMNERDARPGPIQLQGGFRPRVPGADHDDVAIAMPVRFREIVRHLGEVLAGNVQRIGVVVVAEREHQLPSAVAAPLAARLRYGADLEATVAGREAHGLLVLSHPQPEGLHDAPVVHQSLGPVGLGALADEGEAGDLEQLRRREEDHLAGESLDRVDDAALLDHDVAVAGAMQTRGAGETGGASADHDDVVELAGRGARRAQNSPIA